MITRIREVRRARDMTLDDVARACVPPTTPQTIGRLETGIRTVSDNIANVNTPGASRQQAILTEASPITGTIGFPALTMPGTVGDGVLLGSILRVHQDSYDALFRNASSLFGGRRRFIAPLPAPSRTWITDNCPNTPARISAYTSGTHEVDQSLPLADVHCVVAVRAECLRWRWRWR